jgi:two-component system nitrate/nitrite response regulator NarL
MVGRDIRVFLVDDHPVVLRGVRDALSQQQGIEVVGEATSGDSAIRKARRIRPDIVLLDVSMPKITGVDITRKLRTFLPEIKVIAFTMHNNMEYVHEILRQGARGYVLKNTSTDEVVRAIRTVHAGGKYFSQEVSALLLEEHVTLVASGDLKQGTLTSREREILKAIALGLSSKEIAARLAVSSRTVDTHRENIMKKLNIHTAVGLANYAHSNEIDKT